MSMANHVVANTLIGAAASTAVACALAFAVFHGQPSIPLWGPHGALADAVPTSFMTILMSSIIPGLVTRSLVRQGRLAPVVGRSLLPRNPLACGALLAICGTILLCGLAAGVVAALAIDSMSFTALIVAKILTGGVVPIIVTPLAIRTAASSGAAPAIA